jgi:hypothetical protein
LVDVTTEIYGKIGILGNYSTHTQMSLPDRVSCPVGANAQALASGCMAPVYWHNPEAINAKHTQRQCMGHEITTKIQFLFL